MPKRVSYPVQEMNDWLKGQVNVSLKGCCRKFGLDYANFFSWMQTNDYYLESRLILKKWVKIKDEEGEQ